MAKSSTLYVQSKRIFVFSLKKNKNLFINTMTGTTLLVPDVYLKAYNNGIAETEKEKEALSWLAKHGFLFKTAKAEQDFFDKMYAKALKQAKDAPPGFVLVPNFLCNFNCHYCFEPESLRKVNKPMLLEEVEKAFSVMQEMQDKYFKNKHRAKNVFVMGGEPLLPSQVAVFEKMIEQAKKNKMKLQLVTNGYYLKEFASTLKKNHKVFDYIQVTIDGAEEVHNKRRVLMSGKGNTFQRITDGVDTIKDFGIKIKIRMNLDESNSDISGFVEFAKKRGWIKNKNIELHPGVVGAMNECTEYNDLIDEARLQEVISPFKKLSKKNNIVSTVSYGLLLKLQKYLQNMRTESFALQDCLINTAVVFTPGGLLHQCATSMHKPEYAIGKFFPTLEYSVNSSRFGWEKIEDARKFQGCNTCSTAALCAGPCPIFARRKYEKGEEGKCNSPETIVYRFLETYKKDILKLPLWTLK